jgi:hypothetical protein
LIVSEESSKDLDAKERVETQPETHAAHSVDDAKVDAVNDDAADADDHDGASDSPLDSHSPEAIAKRVAAFDHEDPNDVMARDEEVKLAERRAQTKGGKKKKGLEAAASKRLAQMEVKSQAKRASRASRAVDADPVLDRSIEFKKWAQKNQKVVGGVIAVALIALLGIAIWSWKQQKREEEASLALASAVADDRARIGDPDKEKTDDDRPKDPRLEFKTIADRQASALDKYRQVEKQYPGTGAAILARLSEGSLLLDKHDTDGALAAFNDVNASALAKVDAEVRGRAWEGVGFAYELKAQATPADAPANLDRALNAFKELENNVDVLGFHELGMYHQARILEAKGDKDKEKELLKALHERLNKPGDARVFPYLEEVGDDRLRALDPGAIPAKAPGQMGVGPNGPKMTEEQIQRLIEQMKKGNAGAPAGK